MRLREIVEFVRFEPYEWDRTARIVGSWLNVDDARTAARSHLPRAVFDYVDGGADEEITLAENRAAFLKWRFAPRPLVDVSKVDLKTAVLGRNFDAPLALCPTGYTRMIEPVGELAVARAAKRAGVAYCLSTVGTTSIEDLASTGNEELWFQLYVLRDRALAWSLVDRAAAAGYRVLEVAIDTAVSGRRERDLRNGLTIPPSLTPRTLADIAVHLRYWTAMVRSPAFVFANLGRPDVGEQQVTAANMANLFDPTVTWDDLADIRARWPGPMLLKGPVGPDDARHAVDLGLDGIHLSNHGGRQLDRVIPSVELVAPVREAIGDDKAIVVDSGIRHGTDIAISIARGADLCAVGRPYLYGLAGGGESGVARVIQILTEQLRRTMQLMGVTSVSELRHHGRKLLVERTVSPSGP